MTDRLNQLRRQLEEWLRRNELDGDLQFWTQAEWKQRREEYLNDAHLVITTEGSLYHLLNYACDDPKVEELQNLLSSFGFWFDMGHAWSIGIYYEDGYDGRTTPIMYTEKLKDPRWKQKAMLVKMKADQRCQDCGSSNRRLEVHHCWYKYGLEPWQYPYDALRCLCTDCHKKRATVDHDFRCLNAEFTWKELTRIRKCIKELFYWYDRSTALAFLDSVGPDEAKMAQAINHLFSKKTEPGAT